VETIFTVKARPKPGTYYIEIDLVQEGVAWFADKGSGTMRQRVKVAAGDRTGPYSADQVSSVEPKMEMHCVHREEIIRTIKDSGGKICKIVKDPWAGSAYISYTYWITK
jgi:hypothetical protein